jgi:hypothetical protein
VAVEENLAAGDLQEREGGGDSVENDHVIDVALAVVAGRRRGRVGGGGVTVAGTEVMQPEETER